ncbi:hypothetical protein EJB05_15706, partial [Eragrostis curvula]
MADLVIGLAKTTVEGTVTMARAAMDEEDKLKKSVQRDLLIISDEFEMMQSFLHDAKDCIAEQQVTKTLVRQVRNTALDVEDCIETIVHLDKKPHWWRRMILRVDAEKQSSRVDLVTLINKNVKDESGRKKRAEEEEEKEERGDGDDEEKGKENEEKETK